jgi:outer membrane lipopolysaccharide assembly protein LptE/RlpB
MRNLKTKLLVPNLNAKILRTPNSLPVRQAGELRTCSRLFLIIWIALLLGCGYQLVGKETHVPPGLTSVAIPTFANQTFEPGIEVPFTQGFLREFIRERRVKVLDRGHADSTLEGVIKDFRIASVSYDQSGFVLEYQTTVIIDLTLKKRTGEVIWKESDLKETRWYRASSNVLFNEASKASAVQQIGTFVAERVRNRFFYNF